MDSNEGEIPQDSMPSILNNNFMKADQMLTVNLDQEHYLKIQNAAKRSCKILKISTKRDLGKLEAFLKPQEFLQLFIFIIEIENLELSKSDPQEAQEKIENIQKMLLEFSKSRPMILQLASKNEKVTKFYCKEENFEEFEEIDINRSKDTPSPSDFEGIQSFPAILKLLMSKKNNKIAEDFSAEKLVKIKSALILRFVRATLLSEEYIKSIIIECAKTCSRSQLLALLNVPFGYVHLFNFNNQKYLSKPHPFDSPKKKDVKSEQQSVLSAAVNGRNFDLVDFLIKNFSLLIQQLPHDHQVEIATAAFNSGQFKILCDLIQIADLPFPKNFNINSVTDDRINDDRPNVVRLKQLAEERHRFHVAVKEEKFEDIGEFIKRNKNIKIVYGTDNKSTMRIAWEAKKFKLCFELKSIGFQPVDIDDYEEQLKDWKIYDLAFTQTIKNVFGSKPDAKKSVMMLSMRSRIHNVDSEKEAEHREYISNCFEYIERTELGDKLVDVAAQDEELQFIFDFDSKMVDNVDLTSLESLGTTYQVRKWIFIGAKGYNMGRSLEIMGTIAHELCHYDMGMVFENNDEPNFKKDVKRVESYDQIVKELNKWNNQGNKNAANEEDDKCNGIISTVFTLYDENDWNAELIVRVPQILAQYHGDEEKLKQLKKEYELLFEYYKLYVIPEMEKFNLRNRENLRKFNKVVELLPELEDLKVKLSNSKNLKTLKDSNGIMFAQTNIPRLLMLDFHQQYSEIGQDTMSAFVTIKDLEYYSNILYVLQESIKGLKILVDCLKEHITTIPNKLEDLNLIFLVKHERQCEKLKENLKATNQKFGEFNVTYNCNDLTVNSLEALQRRNINFQTGISIDIIDDQLLNLLLENLRISINTEFYESFRANKFYACVYRERMYVDKKNGHKIAQKKLILNSRDQKIVLISDVAGSGKSCALQSITIDFIETFNGIWVTYIDLKKFIRSFKVLKDKPDFLTFMIEYVLKDDKGFESKIFTKLYEIGKVVVLFDGFDEIAPDYYKIVVKIIESFKKENDGNQMWITTRDYFEVDIQQKLGLDVAYKLEDITNEDGSDMIAKRCILHDFERDNEVIDSPADFESSPNFESYQTLAKDLIFKLSTSWIGCIGFPQLYNMIADVSKDDKTAALDMNNFGIYQKFIQEQCKRWSHEKGPVREDASTKVQTTAGSLNFSALHQFHAMKNYFPDEVDFCGVTFDKDEWTDEEIVACGLMTKTGENFYFPHETFQEFFAAEFIINAFRKGQQNVLKFFIKFLTVEKYEIIRMFINDALTDEDTRNRIISKLKSRFKDSMENIDFNVNLPNLFDPIMKVIIRQCDYEYAKEVIRENLKKNNFRAQTTETTLMFQELFIQHLKVKDLEDLILSNKYLIKVTRSCQNVKVLKNFVSDVKEKFNNEENAKIFLTKIFKMKDCEATNILHASVESGDKENVKFIWQSAKELLGRQEFMDLIMQKSSFVFHQGDSILHLVAGCKSKEIHEFVWAFLSKLFKDDKNLEKMILHKNDAGENFMHSMVERSDSLSIIEYTLDIIKCNCNQKLIQEVLASKNGSGRNMLQIAVCYSKDIKCWFQIYKNSFSPLQKFEEVVKEVDNEKCNVLHIAVANYTSEVFNTIIEVLKEVSSSHEIIKDLLNGLDRDNKNLLQKALELSKSLEVHISLWDTITSYFKPDEITQMIKHRNKNQRDLIHYALTCTTPEIAEFVREKIKCYLNCCPFGDVLSKMKINAK